MLRAVTSHRGTDGAVLAAPAAETDGRTDGPADNVIVKLTNWSGRPAANICCSIVSAGRSSSFVVAVRSSSSTSRQFSLTLCRRGGASSFASLAKASRCDSYHRVYMCTPWAAAIIDNEVMTRFCGVVLTRANRLRNART